MNYRHAYHAGNHTEVFKHAALILLLEHLRQKPKPFFVLDTHAGLGQYDLNSAEAGKTGEAQEGIGAVLGRPHDSLAAYLSVVKPWTDRGLYPGSPAIVAGLLREQDRLAACELHPEDVEGLRAGFRRDRRVAVHHRDGYEALPALIPPPERRGLVFIDPPYESRDEAERLGEALVAAARKWPNGIYAAWYPIKDEAIGRTIAGTLIRAGIGTALRAEVLRHRPDGERLAGSGMVFINPPWRLDEGLRRLGAGLSELFAAPRGACRVEALTRRG